MSSHLIRRLAILGAISITGIIVIQGFWLRRAYTLQDSEFHQTVTIALYDVAKKIANFNDSNLPKHNLVQRNSSNCYAVNVNDAIDANILEDYLIRGFEERGLNTDFEYAVYDCFNQELVYGNYCKLSDLEKTKANTEVLPKFEDLTYYFVVRFPSRSFYLLGSMWQNILLGMATLLSLTFFIYSMWVILQQKRLSDLQKDFINNMTHEFKTPISSIKIAAEVIMNSAPILKNDRLKKYSEIIVDQNSRLNNQVEKVLNLARLEQNNFRLTVEKINPIELIRNIVASEKLKIQGSGKGEINCTGTLSKVYIKADRLHFSNVVYNIIDNGMRYCKRVPNLRILPYIKGENLVLDFMDNGIGIKKEELENLFKKFYRISTGNIHDVKGFGLGLYYVKNICTAHGWQIQVDSEPDKGSTFRLKIPILHNES